MQKGMASAQIVAGRLHLPRIVLETDLKCQRQIVPLCESCAICKARAIALPATGPENLRRLDRPFSLEQM